ncbi:MAG: squalene synthase HpnC [Gammaproteobacteria bacterium]|nr:squalene synthase HpnC [Gammaproteobacteria bacterium]
MTNKQLKIESAYAHCQDIVNQHYENFPVASLILPKRLRKPIAAIYAFARRADDYADEGDISSDIRIYSLEAMGNTLDEVLSGATSTDPVFIALADSIKQHQLPPQLFHDLLSAFKQDVAKKRYQTFNELLDYCKRSANPIGRLLLHLNNDADRFNLKNSDLICSGLQLINFYQDMKQDYLEMGRIYVPLNEMDDFSVAERHFKNQCTDNNVRSLMHFQFQRVRKMMEDGAILGSDVKGRLGFQIRLTVHGGLKVLTALEKQKHDLFSRPRIPRHQWVLLLLKACFK